MRQSIKEWLYFKTLVQFQDNLLRFGKSCSPFDQNARAALQDFCYIVVCSGFFLQKFVDAFHD